MKKSKPLKIAVLGVGGIGSCFAFQLARVGGHDVTTIARPGSKRLEELKRDDGIVDVQGERAQVSVAQELDHQIEYDLIIVTLKAYQLPPVLTSLQKSAAKCILFMINIFEPELLRDQLGATRCFFGIPFVQASIDGSGRLRCTIGAGGQKSLIGQQTCVDIFTSSGVPAILEANILLWLRCHIPLCIAFESISVAGMRRGGGGSWSDSMVIARGIQESLKLIKKLGYSVYPAAKIWISRAPLWMLASLLWTVSRIKSFRELLASGEDECRWLVDQLIIKATDAEVCSAGIDRIRAMKPK